MPGKVFIGFDSAWTDNVRNPGAICGLAFGSDGVATFHEPRLATFSQAAEFVDTTTAGADYALIAVDQPTVVPNETGCRPVERVAGSLISRSRGGVQPARRGGGGAAMFGDGAPIWRFLDGVGGIQDPMAARQAEAGRYVMEVFPALALPALIPEIWLRGRSAKYNPAARLFEPTDWALVCSGIESFAGIVGAEGAADYARRLGDMSSPKKADQDRLDALTCLMIALAWRMRPAHETMVIGDGQTGYIVTPVSDVTREVLQTAAAKRGVPVDGVWPIQQSGPPESRSPPIAPSSDREQAEIAVSSPPKHSPPTRPVARAVTKDKARVRPEDLRAFLIERARVKARVTYGDVASAFGFAWTQGFGASLKAALQAVDRDNTERGEPMLMCLVVNKATRLPGHGFYERIGEGGADTRRREALVDQETVRCAAWDWRP